MCVYRGAHINIHTLKECRLYFNYLYDWVFPPVSFPFHLSHLSWKRSITFDLLPALVVSQSWLHPRNPWGGREGGLPMPEPHPSAALTASLGQTQASLYAGTGSCGFSCVQERQAWPVWEPECGVPHGTRGPEYWLYLTRKGRITDSRHTEDEPCQLAFDHKRPTTFFFIWARQSGQILGSMRQEWHSVFPPWAERGGPRAARVKWIYSAKEDEKKLFKVLGD